MKTIEEIEICIEKLRGMMCETNLRKIQYESRGDGFMVDLEINRLTQYQGQISALEWVITK